MLITYRRRGGILALVTVAAVAAVALVATFVAVAMAATLLVVVLGLGAIALAVRALVPGSWRHRRQEGPPATSWPQKTIDATVVKRID